MKVILREDIHNLGKSGEVVSEQDAIAVLQASLDELSTEIRVKKELLEALEHADGVPHEMVEHDHR